MAMTSREAFLAEIEAFIRKAGYSATRFGREALKDPRFVHDLREGRSPSIDTVERVRNFMCVGSEDAA
jgi:2,4-dienoyl-CoA reductase-like NADH-dependent reductase (Old Yellow Enzyme family)